MTSVSKLWPWVAVTGALGAVFNFLAGANAALLGMAFGTWAGATLLFVAVLQHRYQKIGVKPERGVFGPLFAPFSGTLLWAKIHDSNPAESTA